MNASQDPNTSIPIAPWWHTAALLFLLCVFSVLGAYDSHVQGAVVTRIGVPSSHVRVARYLASLVVEWLLVLYVWFGVRRRGLTLRTLIAGRWETWRAALRDLGLAVGFLVAGYTMIGVLAYALRVPQSPDKNPLIPLFPHGGLELSIFFLLSLSAGFCEELVFRGYLMKQLSAATRSETAGLVLQSIVFGLGHGYQGVARMVIIAGEGLLFGLLARWRKSLRPGMMAHALQDTIAGITAFALVK